MLTLTIKAFDYHYACVHSSTDQTLSASFSTAEASSCMQLNESQSSATSSVTYATIYRGYLSSSNFLGGQHKSTALQQ